MVIKSKSIFIFLFVCLTILLGACSDSSNTTENTGSSNSDTEGENTSNTSEQTEEEQITLQVLSPTRVEKPEGDVEQSFADEFMKLHPNVTIEFMKMPMNDAFNQITTMATGGNLPDIYVVTGENIGRVHEMDVAENLNDVFDKEFLNGYNAGAIDQMSVDGELKAMPFFTIPMGMLYRADWFEEAGIAPPKTWEDVVKASEELTGDNRWGFAMLGSADGSGQSRFAHIFRTFGVKELYKDENGEWATDLGTEKAVEAFRTFTDLAVTHEVVPPGPMQTSYGEAITLMANNQAAMMVTGPHSTGAIYAQNPELKGKLGSVPVPKDVEHVTTIGTYGLAISKNSEHKEMAAEYLKFITNKENALKWNEVTGRMPSITEALEDSQIAGPTFKGFVEALDYTQELPSAPFYVDVQNALGVAYQSILAGEATPEEATKKAAETVKELIERNK